MRPEIAAGIGSAALHAMIALALAQVAPAARRIEIRRREQRVEIVLLEEDETPARTPPARADAASIRATKAALVTTAKPMAAKPAPAKPMAAKPMAAKPAPAKPPRAAPPPAKGVPVEPTSAGRTPPIAQPPPPQDGSASTSPRAAAPVDAALPGGAPSYPSSQESVPAPVASPGAGEGGTSPHAPTKDASHEYAARQLGAIRSAIQNHLVYPPLARRMGWTGRVMVRFRVGPGGAVADATVVQSSRVAALDESAVASVRRAAPFAPPATTVDIVVPVVFELEE